ncbi:hypothetical protein D3C71_1404720 [compost metagenome]
MTKKQAKILEEHLNKMQAVLEKTQSSYRNGYDQEMAHYYADDVLTQALNELGFGQLVEAYEKLCSDVGGFWYA